MDKAYNQKSPDGVVEEDGRGDDEHCEADESIELLVVSNVRFIGKLMTHGVVCSHIVWISDPVKRLNVTCECYEAPFN